MSEKTENIPPYGVTIEWGTDEIRIHTIRKGLPTWVLCKKYEEIEELNIIEAYNNNH